MNEAIYHILALAVFAVALVRGYRSGFTGQISGILGFAFGAVSSHVFFAEADGLMRMLFPGIGSHAGASFVYGVLAVTSIYAAVYMLFRMLTGVLRSAMQVFEVGILDRLLGAAFCAVKYLLVLSIVYNVIVCVNPESRLMKYAGADDGNIVEMVLLLAPGLLGCYSFEDLAHLLQLREARKISCNLRPDPCVINKECVVAHEKIKIEDA